MKKIHLGFALLFFLIIPIATYSAPTLASKLKGRILLQVESRGEAWYINPVTLKRIYLADGNSAYKLLRENGVVITNKNLAKIPIGIEQRLIDTDTDKDKLPDKLEEAIGTNPNNPDTDGDGHIDGEEVLAGYNPLGSGKIAIDKNLVNKLKGSILLQVESKGQAWYVNPVDGKRYYMKDGEASYQIMRYLGLGIKNADLEKIDIEKKSSNNSKQASCEVPRTINSTFLDTNKEVGLHVDQGYYGWNLKYFNSDASESVYILFIETEKESVPILPGYSDSTYYPLNIGNGAPVEECTLGGKKGYCLPSPWNFDSFKEHASQTINIPGSNYFSYREKSRVVFMQYQKTTLPIPFVNGQPTSDIPYFPTPEESLGEYVKQLDCYFQGIPDKKLNRS